MAARFVTGTAAAEPATLGTVLPWVRIVTNGPNGAVAGSGFAIGGEPSLIVTAAHVVDGATSVGLTFAREDGGVERAAATRWTASVDFDAADVALVLCAARGRIVNPPELGAAPWGVFEAELVGFERTPTRTLLAVARRGRLLEYVRGQGRARLSGGAVTCVETGRVVGVHSGWVARGDGISTSAATLVERAGLEALADQLEAEVS